MNTAMLLMAQYGKAIVPAADVAHDYFALATDTFLRRVGAGEIRLPLVRMTGSQKSARGIHVNDLAAYIERARQQAAKTAG